MPQGRLARLFEALERLRAPFLLFGSVLVVLMAAPPAAEAQESGSARITWSRDRNDPHWVQGQVNVAAPPEVVWSRVKDVPSWPKLLTDIKWLKVLERGKDRWRVKLETRTFECGAHEYTVTDRGERTLTLEIDAPGIDSIARVLVRNGRSATEANVVYSLYVRATGIVGWFISERELRKKQDAMVIRALTDIQRAFRETTPHRAGQT